MSGTNADPSMRLRIALRDLSPADDPDDFAELVAAFCAKGPPVTLEGAPALALSGKFDLDARILRDWAKGFSAPAPRLRREVVRFLAKASAELGVREG
ncbi:MAG TPA: hypothetical protein VL283_01475 [Candidatus Baltobacteraceae bacterium]|nr:hypothetical protein [Candidatus Baltobacteraceae bacterium]